MSKNLSYESLVKACYRVLLEREPENEDVVLQRVAAIDTPEGIISSFLKSDEHKAIAKRGFPSVDVGVNYDHDRLDIEVDVAPETLDKMFDRVQSEWEALGSSEPYWSVLTGDEYRSDKIQENLEEFYESGQGNVIWLQNLAQRNGVSLGKNQSCLELGCGVGRITIPLSTVFESVAGYDISSGNLEKCEAIIKKKNVINISIHKLERIEEIQNVSPFDVLFSVIVLQHNPPPVQKYILEALLNKINPGGIAYFQLPTYLPGYSFFASDYLSGKAELMEMHALPMREVLALLAHTGFEVLEVIQDQFTGMPGSHAFFAVKTGTV